MAFVARGVGVEDENHQPNLFGIMALPTARVARALDFDSLCAVLDAIGIILPFWQKVGVAVVVEVPTNGLAVIGDCCPDELADDAAEIRRHEERLEAVDFLCVELSIHEAEEVDEFLHCQPDMVGRHSIGNLRASIERAAIDRYRLACNEF
ncbi:MAG TPA: hypothetical protein PK867_27420 [Pirellulales bacterium]|nr:hypothetical protein [Pirellulales bacterium]